MGFVNDLENGKAYENKVREWINTVWRIGAIENQEKTGIDIVSPSVDIEVKYDNTCTSTGNLFIEYQCGGVNSGVMRYDDGLFIIGDDNFAYIFRIKYLQELVFDWLDNSTYRNVKGGDGWRVSGILLPLSEASKYAEGKIYFN